jgi:hypothetical protein
MPRTSVTSCQMRVYMIDKLTATRSVVSPSTKIITHYHPPDRDRRGSSGTLRMDLRIGGARSRNRKHSRG